MSQILFELVDFYIFNLTECTQFIGSPKIFYVVVGKLME